MLAAMEKTSVRRLTRSGSVICAGKKELFTKLLKSITNAKKI